MSIRGGFRGLDSCIKYHLDHGDDLFNDEIRQDG